MVPQRSYMYMHTCTYVHVHVHVHVGGCARRGETDSRSGAENAPGAMPKRSLAEDAAPACAARGKV